MWLLPSNQHDSEASFVSHHQSVSFGSGEELRLFPGREVTVEKNGFGLAVERLDEGQEFQSSFRIIAELPQERGGHDGQAKATKLGIESDCRLRQVSRVKLVVHEHTC